MSRLFESSLTGKISNILVEEENKNKAKFCPRCGNKMSGYPAVSRYDNETEICSECGTSEAMLNYTGVQVADPHRYDTKTGKKLVKECAKSELKESLSDELADFMKDLDPYGYKDAYWKDADGDEELMHKAAVADIENDYAAVLSFLQDVADYEESTPDMVARAKEFIRELKQNIKESDEITPEDLEKDDEEIKRKSKKEVEDRIAELKLAIEDGVSDEEKAEMEKEIADLENKLNECGNAKGKLLTEAWNGRIKSGAALRELLGSMDEDASPEECQKVLDALKTCCEEAKTLTDDEYYQNGFQSVIDDIEMIYDDEDLSASNVDWELDGFYDWCDGANLWVELTEAKLRESAEGIQEFWNKFNNGEIKIGDDLGGIKLLDANEKADYILADRGTEFVAAWAPELSDGKLVWGQGHYFDKEEDAREYFNGKLNEGAKVLTEDSYEKGIFKDIEDALVDAGFSVDRYIDVGVLTKNIGWEVSKDGKHTQLDCPGSWYDEDEDDEDYDESDKPKKLKESDEKRYYILRDLQKCFDELDSIDYGDQEGTERYGKREPGIEEQNKVNEKIKEIVQKNNITKKEFSEVFEPYSSGLDLSYEDYAYEPKHATEEDKEKLMSESVTVVTADGSSVNTQDAASVSTDASCTTVVTDNTTVTICNDAPVENELLPTEGEIVPDEPVDEVPEEPVEDELTEEAEDDSSIVSVKSLSVVKNQGNVFMLTYKDSNDNEQYVVCEDFNNETNEGNEAETYSNKDDADKDYFARLDVNTAE